MYIIDTDNKQSRKIEAITFSSLGLKERDDLQEWIVKEPAILGEELLIIQKEFSGFLDTNERLDLLAIDRKGNLVIIENKLDDSGKDVTWQAMKYASYCSTLGKDGIRKIYQDYLNKTEPGIIAEDKICDFLNKSDFDEVQLNHDLSQRIILVAREFRKEVTSTVLWARKFRIQIQCIKVTPYLFEGHLLLDTEQIIPVKDVADITISLDEKAHDEVATGAQIAERELIRDRFWKELLPKMNAKSQLYSGISTDSTHYDHWLTAGAGMSGLGYSFVITKKYAAVELGINKPVKEDNKAIYDELIKHKDEIEQIFGKELTWQRLDDKKMSRITSILEGVNVFNDEDWPEMQTFLVEHMIRLNEALKKSISKLKQTL
ncbi:DUF4268 domain-containing protein [Eubacteriaceae bacterium ES3]|nr:DUF4268 domain-containing protein [Eubacteriaceae bacterium ES3]